MAVDLRQRNLLALLDLTPGEIRHLLDLAAALMAEKRMHTIEAVLAATLGGAE